MFIFYPLPFTPPHHPTEPANRSPKRNLTLGFTGSIRVYLSEYVLLLRNNNYVSGTTWNQESVIVDKTQGYPQHARSVVSDLVDMFLNDYLAANPKEQPTKDKVKKQDIEEKPSKSGFDLSEALKK